MADISQDRDDSFEMMPRTSDDEAEKGEEEDGGKSEDASGSSRTTSEGSSGGNAQEVLLAISKAYTSGRLGTAPPASHREQGEVTPVHDSSAPLHAIQVSSAEESEGSGPSAATGPSAASKEELSPLVLPPPLFDDDPAARQLPFAVTALGATQSAAVTTTTTTMRATEAAAPVATVTASATFTAVTPPRIPGAMRRGLRRRHSTGSADEYLDSEGSVHYRLREGQKSELEREVSEIPKVTDLRDAVRSGLKDNVTASLDECSNVRQELMAQNAANGAGLLMLAVTTGKINILEFLASEIQRRLGTPLLAKQLRYEDDKETPLMFYAAKSSLSMFRAVRKLVRDTIGRAGLTEQLRHQCARGRNILMEASSDPDVFAEVWTLASRAGCLDELLEERDLEGRNWILHAAEAGNLAVFKQLDRGTREMYDLFSTEDVKGWSGFMYAARGKGDRNNDFLTMLCGMCFPEEKDPLLSEQLTRVAEDDDASTLLMHAAIGGRESYAVVCRMIREAGCVDRRGDLDRDPVLLSWAAKGGDVLALNAVAEGIKTGDFRDEVPYGTWYDVRSAEEAARLLDAIETCAKRRAGVSLYLSAIESGCLEMMTVVLDGIKDRVQDAKVRWEMLCGIEGNPLTLAASRSVECFRATLRALKGVSLQDTTGSLKPKVLKLLLPSTKRTPLCNAVFTEDSLLFDEVLKQATTLYGQSSSGGAFCAEMILEQVKYAMRDVDEERRLSEEWISAKMLAKVLQAAKEVDKDSQPAGFDVELLDNFVKLAVSIGAFDHIRELLKIGCDLVKHFPTLLSKIAKNENNTTECIMLAITAASNPFVECGIASQAIYEATVKRNLNHAALERLHQKIGDLSLELLEHLPHSVSGVGEELARGDLNLEPFNGRFIGKIKPSELLGFVVVGWMLEGSSQSSVTHDSPPLGGENSLAQAVRAGPRALDLLSEALILDYLGLKFYRTLPRWNTQKPFERNINQTFYSYTHQVTAARESEQTQYNGGVSQRLLLLLQGWTVKDRIMLSRPHRTVLPGLQFTLSGIMGKPVSYYVVPAIRMLFIVINYLITIGLYMSCVSLEKQRILENEWAFYLVMLGVAWREILEFSSAHKLEPGLGSSIERYFYDKWNFLDVTTIGLVLVAFVFRIMEFFTGDSLDLALAQFFLAATAPFLFSRVLFLSQVGSALGPTTQVIFNMLTQLVQFSLILLLVMIGFAASFNALYGRNTILVEQNVADCDVEDHPIVEAFGTLEAALLTMFQYMLGEFSFEVFYAHYENEDGEDCGGVSKEEFGITLLVIYLVITAVMLLNLLIAVLSTAHAEVHQNSTKEFQLARAKIILQSGDDVLNDVIPPPFNLVKPLLGIFWPASSREDGQWDRWWEIITGTIHRILFWLVVGLSALVMTILLWVVSIPLRAWSIYQRMRGDTTTTGKGNKTDPKAKRSVHTARRATIGQSPSRLRSFKDDEIATAIERIFFVSSGSRKGRISPTHALSTLVKVLQMLVAILLAVVMCLVLYPLLGVLLWLRGFGNILHYMKQMYSKTTRWERRQVDLGEEEEWSVARTHAIRRNRRYATANSSENEFNVDALLKTTTGMTMEDLRQKMVNLKSARRRMALTASLDAVMSQFPLDDKRL